MRVFSKVCRRSGFVASEVLFKEDSDISDNVPLIDISVGNGDNMCFAFGRRMCSSDE